MLKIIHTGKTLPYNSFHLDPDVIFTPGVISELSTLGNMMLRDALPNDSIYRYIVLDATY